MSQVGGLKQIGDTILSQIEECNAWLDKELAPLRSEVDKAITVIAQAIIDLRQDKITTGVQRLDSFADVLRTEVVKNQIIGLCWTVVRVGAVALAAFVINHPFAKAAGELAFVGHAIYKGMLAVENADAEGKSIESALDAALKAFLYSRIILPLSYAVDKTVEGLHSAANDLQLAKGLFTSIGGCL
jgi:hypothetical protein